MDRLTERPGIRAIDPSANEEIELVAARMRLTLAEVLGQETGESMYPMDWLINAMVMKLSKKLLIKTWSLLRR